MTKRDLVSVSDLSNEEIEAIFATAEDIIRAPRDFSSLCSGLIMATLFYEPSTRTRLSFETAMLRLGGHVISCADMKTSSYVKGESLADTARVVGSYADLIVIRHPWEGAARVAAQYAGVPVINGGDGGHEHPTQTLCDLFTLIKEKHKLKGLCVALWGDLKYGRTIHSLAYGLARFGANIICLPAEGMEMPEYVSRKLQEEYRCGLLAGEATDIAQVMEQVDAVYLNPATPRQLTLLSPDGEPANNVLRVKRRQRVRIDALYMTRLQKEKRIDAEAGTDDGMQYPVLNAELLKRAKLRRTVLMHPLPRVDELPYEVDDDPRSIYFKQAAWGVPVRMALVAHLLGAKESPISKRKSGDGTGPTHTTYKREYGVRCLNPSCISLNEPKYIVPEFEIVSTDPLRLRCVYCDREKHPLYVASTKWHQSTIDNRKYHSSDSSLAKQIKPENLIVFDSEDEAKARGFMPSHYASEKD